MAAGRSSSPTTYKVANITNKPYNAGRMKEGEYGRRGEGELCRNTLLGEGEGV